MHDSQGELSMLEALAASDKSLGCPCTLEMCNCFVSTGGAEPFLQERMERFRETLSGVSSSSETLQFQSQDDRRISSVAFCLP